MRFEGKVALVTGAGSGIGAEVCRMIAAEGGRIAMADLNYPSVERAAAEIGAAAIPLRLDVTRLVDWEAAVSKVSDAFGKLNVFISNAGIALPGSAVEIAEEDWKTSFAVHVDGLFHGVRACLPLMTCSGEPGAIVTLGTLVASRPRANQAAYCASKAAAVMLTKSIALDCAAKGLPIRANCVHPGATETPMLRGAVEPLPESERHEAMARLISTYPMRRAGLPSEVARAILYLASEDSSFTTGADIAVDGGGAIRE